MAYKVVHIRVGCIGCGNCAAVCPEFWSMGKDGKSDLKGAKKVGDDYEREFNTDDGLECNQKAASGCPVSVIKIVKKK